MNGKKISVPLIALLSALALVGCNRNSSESILPPPTDVGNTGDTGDKPITTPTDGGEETTTTVPSVKGDVSEVKELKLASLPQVEVKESLDLSLYLTLVLDDGSEAEVDEVSGARDALSIADAGDDTHTAMVTSDGSDPLKMIGLNIGKGLVSVVLTRSETDVLSIEGEVDVVINDEMTEMMNTLSTIKDNFTVTMEAEGMKGVRTSKYYSTGTEGGVILSDGKLYKFTSSDISGKGFMVSPSVIAVDGAAGLEEAVGTVSITPEELTYDPSMQEQLGFEYALYGEDNIRAIMQAIGLSDVISLQSTIYIVLELGIKDISATSVTLCPLLVDYNVTQMVYLSDVVVSSIGTSSLSYVEDYIASGTIPTSDVVDLADKFKEISDTWNYTVTSSGALYHTGTDTVYARDELPEEATFGDMYDALYGDRLLQITEDGMWSEGYMYDSYSGGAFSKSDYGYCNHNDGTVYTFTMEDGKAVLGSQDFDYTTFQPTQAPYYNSYKINLNLVDEDCINGANMVRDSENPNLYHYTYADDVNKGSYFYDTSFGSKILEVTYSDMLELLLDDSYGATLMTGMTMDVLVSDDGISYTATIPLAFTEDFSADFKITTEIKDVGTTVINGLADILDDEPSSGGDWGDWYY